MIGMPIARHILFLSLHLLAAAWFLTVLLAAAGLHFLAAVHALRCDGSGRRGRAKPAPISLIIFIIISEILIHSVSGVMHGCAFPASSVFGNVK